LGDIVKGKPAANGTQDAGKQRLVSKLGDMGAVIHEAMNSSLDDKLATLADKEGKKLSALTTDFSAKVKDVSERAARVEGALASISIDASKAKTAAGEAKEKADAAETSSISTAAKVTELTQHLTGEVPELVTNEDGSVEAKMVQKEPKDFLSSVLASLTGAVTMVASAISEVAKINERLDGLEEGLKIALKDLGYDVKDSGEKGDD